MRPIASSPVAASCERQAGFLFASLAPLLLLLCLSLGGAVAITLRAQAKMALQARLDECAVALVAARARTLGDLRRANLVLRASARAIYAARGAKLAGPVGAAFGGLSEAALLAVNHGAAAAQRLRILRAQAQESLQVRCANTAFSREIAWCRATPALALAFRREPTRFADVNGPLVHKAIVEPLARFRCTGGRNLGTTLRLDGDPALAKAGWWDRYEE